MRLWSTQITKLIIIMMLVLAFDQSHFVLGATVFVSWFGAWTVVFEGLCLARFSTARLLILSVVSSSCFALLGGGLPRRLGEIALLLAFIGSAARLLPHKEPAEVLAFAKYILSPFLDRQVLFCAASGCAIGVMTGQFAYHAGVPNTASELFIRGSSIFDGLFTAAFTIIGIELGLHALAHVVRANEDVHVVSLVMAVKSIGFGWTTAWLLFTAVFTAVGGGFLQKYVVRHRMLGTYTKEDFLKWVYKEDPLFACALFSCSYLAALCVELVFYPLIFHGDPLTVLKVLAGIFGAWRYGRPS
jgi:hypothetical protein